LKKQLQQTAIGFTLLFGVLAPAPALAATETVAPSTIADSIIASGLKYLGTPYLYGADPSQTSTFDCSSFTFRAFIENGINLPRTANTQMGVGAAVTMAQAIPGDLIFFKDSTYPTQAGHVGIYLGNGKMLHASTSKGVITSDLSTPYWQQRFMAVKRIIPPTYTVQSGDTLWKISLARNVTVQELRTWNKLSSDELKPGKQLMVSNPDLLMSQVYPKGASYVVQPGDTLWLISSKMNVTIDNIRTWNNLQGDGIMVGQRLKLEASYKSYTVAPGDSLWSVSQKTKTPEASIKAANGLKSDTLFVNQVLKIPVSF
jgi:LysM repeat protein